MEYKNFAYSRIVTAPSPATTGTNIVITTGDGTLFPTTPFNAVIWPVGEIPLSTNAEIITVNDSTGDIFIIERQQESTSARTVIIGDRISATITAYTARTFKFLNHLVKTSNYTAVEDDDLIICNSLSDFTIDLMEATNSGRILNIKNINTGVITVEGYNTDTIDGNLNQTLNQWENLQICDYDSNVWVIV